MERITIHNYAALRRGKDNRPYTIVRDNDGNETGIRLEGYLTTWNEVNGNGQKWLDTAYDETVSTYFEGNDLNIPLDVMHTRDISNLVGVVEECEKDRQGLKIKAFVTSGAEKYGTVKALLDCGALQGFSNYGYLDDYTYEGNSLVVKSFVLISASLVDVPADTGGKFMGNSTNFKGFATTNEGKEEGETRFLTNNVSKLQNEIGIYGISF